MAWVEMGLRFAEEVYTLLLKRSPLHMLNQVGGGLTLSDLLLLKSQRPPQPFPESQSPEREPSSPPVNQVLKS